MKTLRVRERDVLERSRRRTRSDSPHLVAYACVLADDATVELDTDEPGNSASTAASIASSLRAVAAASCSCDTTGGCILL
jgi:hypothetical protein